MTIIARYRLDGDGDDHLGKRPATAANVGWSNGKLRLAADFNGSSSYLSTPVYVNDTKDRPMSIAGWMFVRSHSGRHALVGCNTPGVKTQLLINHLDGVVDMMFANHENAWYTSAAAYNYIIQKGLNAWIHLCSTWDGKSDPILYVDAQAFTATKNYGGDPNNVTLDIGRGYRSTGTRYADAKINDVCLFDHAISRAELMSLYQLRTTYLSMKGHFFDVESGEDLAASGVGFEYDETLKRDVAVFNAAGEITLPTPFGQLGNDQMWTVEALIYRTDLTGEQYFVRGMNLGLQISHTSSNTRPLMYLNSGANDYYMYAGASSMPAGQWLHILYTFDNATGYRRIFVNGKDESAGGPNDTTPAGIHPTGLNVGRYFKGKMAMFACYARSMSAEEVARRYRSVFSVDDRGSLLVGQGSLIESGQTRDPLVDYSVWKDDGSFGTVDGFGSNGDEAKNTRVTTTGPHGEEVVAWQATNTDTASTADGGWNTDQFPIDNTKLYRFTTWMRRSVLGNGQMYFGVRGYGTINGLERLNGSRTTNPYFVSGGISVDDWILYVGFVYPHDYDGPVHPDAGRYYKDGTRIGGVADWKWLPGTERALHRAYLYYSGTVGVQQQWVYPRVDVVDGTEPSLDDLLNGYDLDWARAGFPKSLDLRRDQLALGRVSEVGLAKGLLHAFDMTRNLRDACSPRVGTNSGIRFSDVGGYFDGVSGGELGTLEPLGNEWTVMCVYNGESFSKLSHLISAINQSNFAFKITHTASESPAVAYFHTGSTGSLLFNTPLVVGREYHIAIAYKDGVMEQYLDGVLDKTHSVTVSSIPSLPYRVGLRDQERSQGYERDLKLYNRRLTPFEIHLQSQRSLSRTSIQKTRAGILTANQLRHTG